MIRWQNDTFGLLALRCADLPGLGLERYLSVHPETTSPFASPDLSPCPHESLVLGFSWKEENQV